MNSQRSLMNLKSSTIQKVTQGEWKGGQRTGGGACPELQEVGGRILHDTDLFLSTADDYESQHKVTRLFKMHNNYTNRYEKQYAKELNWEQFFKKQAQLHPKYPISSLEHHIRRHPNWTTLFPQQLLHTHIILSTSSKKLVFHSSASFLLNIYLSQIKDYFIF